MSKVLSEDPMVLRNAWKCPHCGSETRVYSTRPPFRYRRCGGCKFTYRTQEVHQASADVLLRFVDLARETFDAAGLGPTG